MLRKSLRRLVPRLALLLAMTGALIFLPADLSREKASARTFCCCNCDFDYQQCLADCAGRPIACRLACNSYLRDCQAMCDPTCNDCL